MNLKALRDLDLDANFLLDTDHLLSLVGLRPPRTAGARVAQRIGAVGAGLLIGTGLRRLLAPKAGRETRPDVRERLRQASAELDYVGHPTSVCGSPGEYRTG